jgi:hypothetical protein
MPIDSQVCMCMASYAGIQCLLWCLEIPLLDDVHRQYGLTEDLLSGTPLQGYATRRFARQSAHALATPHGMSRISCAGCCMIYGSRHSHQLHYHLRGSGAALQWRVPPR